MAADPRLPHPTSARVASGSRRPNTVGLAQSDLSIFLDRLEDGAPTKAGHRDFVRWPFRQVSVRMEIIHTDGGRIPLQVACRNLSRTGMAVLHNAYMHPGVRCTLMLPHSVRGDIPIAGRVVRCTHRTGMIHEIGIRFSDQIDVRQFVRHDPFSDCFSLERVRPADLRGSLLCVEPAEMSVKILRHFLRETALTIRTAAGIAEAMAAVEDGEDLVICEYHLPDGDAPDLIDRLRARGVRAPVIVTTSDTTPQTRKALAGVKAAALLAKPYTQDTLLRAAAEFLIVQARPDRAKAAPTSEASALMDSFIQAAPAYAAKLRAALESGDAAAARDLCFQISGAAPTVGFRELGDLASAAGRALAKALNVSSAETSLRAVIASCERIKPKAAA